MDFILSPSNKIYKSWMPIFFLCLFLSGCSRNRLLNVCDPDNPCKGSKFNGIEFSGIESNDKNVHVKVLIVHGIGGAMIKPPSVDEHHDFYKSLYSYDLVQGLQTTLKLRHVECQEGHDCSNKTVKIPVDKLDKCCDSSKFANCGEAKCGDYGFVQEENYVSDTLVTYTFYTLVWANLTEPFKTAFLGNDSKDRGNRELFNQKIKAQLLDQGISDAVLFAGTFREHMESSVRQAICIVLTDQPCSNSGGYPLTTADKVFVISHSLGSRMVFDVLGGPGLDKTETDASVNDSFRSCLAGVFMLANQLPLLELSDQTQSRPGGSLLRYMIAEKSERGGLGNFIGKLKESREKRKDSKGESARATLPIIAFSDPNDLLSYALPRDWREFIDGNGSDYVHFINAFVQNRAFYVRFLFDYPGQVHVGYWKNPVVWDIIAHGSKARLSNRTHLVDVK